MPEKPLFAHDYTKENVELVRQNCLYVSTKLGDLMDDLICFALHMQTPLG